MITKQRFDELYARVANSIAWYTLNLSAINEVRAGHIQFDSKMYADHAGEQVHLLSDLVTELHKEIEKNSDGDASSELKG